MRSRITLLGINFAGCLILVGCRCASPPTATFATSPPMQATPAEYWVNALEEVYKSPLELQAQHQTERNRQVHLRKLMRGDPRKPQIAITFDDGPHPDFTPGILKALADANVKATFFLVGEKAEQAPDLVRMEFAGGHNVGNHTYHHVNLTKIPERLVETEIEACGDVLRQITGKQPHLFRPPGGDYSLKVGRTVNGLGYGLILWTDDPADYARPAENVLMDRTLSMATNGGIVLIHDGVPETVALLPAMLQDLKTRGFELVTIDQMLEDPTHE